MSPTSLAICAAARVSRTEVHWHHHHRHHRWFSKRFLPDRLRNAMAAKTTGAGSAPVLYPQLSVSAV